jgi:hypothetical protein
LDSITPGLKTYTQLYTKFALSARPGLERTD